jgi:prolyl-tRNA synthetase
VAGYALPIGVSGVQVVVDDLVAQSTNLVAGANKEGYHLHNVNYGRDYEADVVADIASAYEGAPCPSCGGPVRLERAIEVGNIFKLGTKYTAALKAQYRDEAGEQHPIVMGCYGIGVERLMAAVVEASHDERGIIWPIAVAPYHVYLVVLNQKDESVMQTAEQLYGDLGAAGITVLFDDRNESPGVKFTDADLLGMPLRITVSRRTLKNDSVELKLRTDKDFTLVPLAEAVTQAQTQIDALQGAIDARVLEEEFEVGSVSAS